MTFKARSLSTLVLALGIAGGAYAQDAKTTTPDAATRQAAKADRHAGKHGDFAGRKFGRRGPGGEFGRLGGPMGRFGGFGHGVTLTDAQKEQIRKIHETNKPDQALMQELRTIMEARRSGNLTDAQKARVKEIREQQAAKAKSVHEQVQAVLTTEQKAQIQKNLEERKARREQMRDRIQDWRKNHQTKPDAKTAPTKPITE